MEVEERKSRNKGASNPSHIEVRSYDIAIIYEHKMCQNTRGGCLEMGVCVITVCMSLPLIVHEYIQVSPLIWDRVLPSVSTQ